MIPVGFISTLGRLRETDAAQVAALADSIAEVGLLNPITVYACEIVFNGQRREGFGLVAGAHRLEAVKRLGWDEIPAVVVDLDENQRIIAECDENLCGTKLSPAEVAMFTAKRKAAYEALHPETVREATLKRGDATPSRQVGETGKADRFTADTAAKTGQSERSVQRSATRGEKVSPAALAMVKGTKLDTGAYLDKLARLSADRQVATVDADLREKPQPRRAPDPENDLEVKERQLAALMSAWNRAGKEARAEFLDRIETPVMSAAWNEKECAR